MDRIVVTRTSARPAFLRIDWWPEPEAVLGFLYDLGGNAIFGGAWVLARPTLSVLLVSVYGPERRALILGGVAISGIVRARPRNLSHHFRVHELGL